MNAKQKYAVAVGTALLFAATLFPPWTAECSLRDLYGSYSNSPDRDKYGLLFQPPELVEEYGYGSLHCMNQEIDFTRLGMTYLLFLVPVVGAVLLLAGSKPQAV